MRPALVTIALVLNAGCGSSGGKDLPPLPTFDGASNPGTGPVFTSDDAATDLAPAPLFADAARPEAGQTVPDAATTGPDGPGAGSDTAGTAPADSGPVSADAGPDLPPPRPMTLQFTGTVATVAGTPLGLDSTARTAAVTGTFTYDLNTPDARPVDPQRGRYEHGTTSGFTFTVLNHTVEGSGFAVVQIENLNPDTFRFLDGPGIDTLPRTMKLDGKLDPMLKLHIAITDGTGGIFQNDALPDPFPALDIARTPHTFSLSDSGGTLLMQLTSLTKK